MANMSTSLHYTFASSNVFLINAVSMLPLLLHSETPIRKWGFQGLGRFIAKQVSTVCACVV